MRLLELFAGYGSQKLAFERLGIKVDSEISEIDEYAIKAYNQIHGQTKNWGDICKINENELGDFDMITYSSPCQDFSKAGKQRGGEKGSGTRSSLLWECERIIRKVKPKYLLMENVKALVSKKFKPCFDKWLKVLEDLGYDNYWQVLNAKDYGIPQNRERVFVISVKKSSGLKYEFPKPEKPTLRLADMLDEVVPEKYYLSEKQIESFLSSSYNQEKDRCQFKDYCDTILSRDHKGPKLVVIDNQPRRLGNIYGSQFGTGYAGNVWDKNAICPTLMTGQGGGRVPMIVEPSVLKDPQDLISKGIRIRKLTPKEYFRLMGVRDEEFNRLEGLSNTQLYKMAGNSIVVDVLTKIFSHLEIKKDFRFFG